MCIRDRNVDKHNRFRSITVGFRVSPEENEELNRAVALSGLPKQEYCYRKCMAVSYTHLDVYKRQTQHSAEMKNAEFIILEIWILTG